MPIPSPRSGEDEGDFIGRCMGDATMRREFSEQTQRAAVCYRAWRDRGKAAKMPQAEAGYVDRSPADGRCGGCTMFEPPASCSLVAGDVNQYGWCRWFEPERPAGLAKGPDDTHTQHIADATARAALTGLDLGDWSVLVDPTADELAAVYASGARGALPLVGFVSDETVNEVRAAMGLDPVEGGDAVPAIVAQPDVRAVEWARLRAAELVKGIEENTREMLRATVTQAVEEGWGAVELAAKLEQSAGFSSYRAETIARTEVIRANNQGALAAYKETGVATAKGWITAGDDLVEEICEDNEAQGYIPLDDDFDSGDDAPPAHPNAVFEGTSFCSYGQLHQLLRSRYDGPAVTIHATLAQYDVELPSGDLSALSDLLQWDVLRDEAQCECDLIVADRSRGLIGVRPADVVFSIGPNHPVLTRRGFVVACELREGDQLLYDRRVDGAVFPSVEFDFDEVPSIEDVFGSLVLLCGKSSVHPVRTYFHGDEVAAHGEIDVVRPTRDLLPVLDVGCIEHLSECDLTRTYADALHVSSCRSCFEKFDGVFLTASRCVGRGSGGPALLGGGVLPPDSEVLTITSRHDGFYSGWAFDASTESGLYNYGGVVVKNCRCALVPGFDEDLADEDKDEEGG